MQWLVQGAIKAAGVSILDIVMVMNLSIFSPNFLEFQPNNETSQPNLNLSLVTHNFSNNLRDDFLDFTTSLIPKIRPPLYYL